MTEYIQHGVNLSSGQAHKIYTALKNNEGVTIKLSKSDLNGKYKLALTKSQMNRISKGNAGLQLKLSAAQLKHMKHTGGFLPLLTLIPLIAGAVGSLSGAFASAVSAAKSNAEQARHNRAIEAELAKPTGAGIKSAKLLKECECELKRNGFGLYLGPSRPQGSGFFL